MTDQMIPKTLNLVECRRCGSQFFKGETLTLKPGDLVAIQPSSLSRCPVCEEVDQRDRRVPGAVPKPDGIVPPYRMGNTNKKKRFS